jgi:hypothetical protein
MTRRLILIAATMAALVTAAPAAAATPTLVGQWRLNDGAGSVAADSSGYGDNGAVVGPAGWFNGPDGGGLKFDGGAARIQVPDEPQLDPANSVTVSAWVERTGSPGAYKYVVAKGGHGCIAASYGLYSGPNGGLQFYVSRGTGTVYARSPDAGVSVWDGQWHLAVGTFDGVTIRLYVDGVQIGQGTQYPGRIEYQLSDSNDLFIGAYPTCSQDNFDGAISDVRIWNAALGASQVAQLNPPPPPAPPSGPGTPATPSPEQPGTVPPASSVSPAPILRALKLGASTFSLSAVKHKSVISYADSQPASVTLTLSKLSPKARCPRPPRNAHHKTPAHCPRYVKLGSFTHSDHSGRNTVRLPARFRVTPGSYLIDAIPSFRGTVGTTLKIAFIVTR